MNLNTIRKAAVSAAFFLSGTSIFGLQAQAQDAAVDPKIMEVAATLRDAALKSDSAWELVESITTEVGQRIAGSPKELQAIEWGKAKLTAMGFDKVYTEPVMVRYWERLSESAQVLGEHSQNLSVTALGKSVSTPKGGVTAEIVPFASVEALEAADPAMVKGKIAFIMNRMERHKDGAGYGPAVKARGNGPSIAAGKGAAALLIRSIGTDSHRMPHTGGLNYAEDQPKIAAGALANPDADQLERLLKRGPVKMHLDIQTKDHGMVESANLIGEITGREKPDEVVLIGGHIDSWDLGTGAIDDGAGVALTAAAANLIQDMTSERPRRTIRVVMYAAEEPGLVGAKAYAEAHKNDVAKHVVGAESDFGAGRVWALAASVGDGALPAIDAMAQLMGPLGVVRREGAAEGGPDVGQMAAIGMPAVDLMQDGTNYFDLHHTADDTLDKIDPDALKQNLAAWVVFSYIAAEWPGSFK